MTGPRTITRLLIDWGNGDNTALDELTPLYDQRFSLNLTDEQKKDLVAFLTTL
jgi:hypothetical protein